MIKWSDYVYTKSVVHFKRVALTKIEFALLVAIILTKAGKTLICKGELKIVCLLII